MPFIPSRKTSSVFMFIAVGLVLMVSYIRTAAQQSSPVAANNPPSPAGQRRALLVGISDYDHGTNPDDGFGSLNTGPDLVSMKYVLKTYYGFPEANIGVLQNESATQENIATEFKRQLIDKAKPGDQVVFYYTGHGHFVVDTNGDEVADHLDEVLVTWVPKAQQSLAPAKRHAIMYMLDDTYESLLKQLTQMMKGADGKVAGSITVIFDSCHSGSATKGIGLVPKGRPWKESIDGPLPATTTTSEVASGWLTNKSGLENVVFLAASRSDQLSYMMPNSVKNGSILTYFTGEFLTDAAKKNSDIITYSDLFRWVGSKASGMRAAQTPQIEGPVDTRLFGDGRVVNRATSLASVQRVQTAPLRLELNQGMLHGVTKGSRFDIYKNGTDVRQPGNKIGELEITDNTSITSVGLVTKVTPANLAPAEFEAAQAVVTEYQFEGQPLRVLVEDLPEDKVKVLRDAVSTLAFITREGVTSNSYDVKLGFDANNGKYFYQRATAGTLLLTEKIDVPALQQRLMADWRWRRLANLTFNGPPKVHIDILAVDGTPWKRSEGGTIVLRPGDKAQVVCTNNSGSPMFITLIYLKATGEIETFPSPELVNGQQALNADNKTQHLFDIDDVTAPRGTEVEILKIIATPRPADFSGMAFSQKGREGRAKGPRNPLEEVLFGLVDQNAKDVKIRAREIDEWYTDQIVYEVRPSSAP